MNSQQKIDTPSDPVAQGMNALKKAISLLRYNTPNGIISLSAYENAAIDAYKSGVEAEADKLTPEFFRLTKENLELKAALDGHLLNGEPTSKQKLTVLIIE